MGKKKELKISKKSENNFSCLNKMSKPEPANKTLYEKVKKEAKSKFEHWPSAYGSQWLVKTYKERGGTYTGGQKKETSGVTRWNKEKWTDEHGNICGSKNNKNIKKM